jgi:hypothetical protein
MKMKILKNRRERKLKGLIHEEKKEFFSIRTLQKGFKEITTEMISLINRLIIEMKNQQLFITKKLPKRNQ